MNFKISLAYGRMQNINDRDVKFNQTLEKKYNITIWSLQKFQTLNWRVVEEDYLIIHLE